MNNVLLLNYWRWFRPKRIEIPECVLTLLKTLYPTVNWNNVSFYQGLPWFIVSTESNNMKLYLIIFGFLIMLVSACCPKKTYMLPEDRYAWVPYELGQIAYYTSGDVVDTIEVVEYTQKIDKRTSECANFLHEKIKVTLTNEQIKIFVDVNKKDIGLSFMYEDKRTFRRYFFDNNYANDIPLYSLYEIKNTIYYNVFVLSNNNVEFYYGKNIGLIGYKINNILYTKM